MKSSKAMEQILQNRLERIRTDLDAYLSASGPILSAEEAPAPMQMPIECEAPETMTQAQMPYGHPIMAACRPVQKAARRPDLDRALEQKGETFSTMLLRLIDEKGLKDSAVYKQANIDRRLFSKIRGDEDYLPSKKTAISFCLALQLDLAETRELLAKAGYALSEASRFDLIITYLIQNEEYNIHFANIVLDDYGEGTLSK